jgi:hypothetical protein
LGLKVLFGAPLIPIGFWIGYRGLVRDRYDRSRWAMLKCLAVLLIGSAISTAGIALIVV